MKHSESQLSAAFTLSSNTERVQNSVNECRELIETGKQILDAIESCLQRITELNVRLNRLVTTFSSIKSELKRWLPNVDLNEIDDQLSGVSVLIKNGDLDTADTVVETVRKDLQDCRDSAEALKQKAIRDSKIEAAKSHIAKVTEECQLLNKLLEGTSPGILEFFNENVARFRTWHDEAIQYLVQCSLTDDCDLDSILQETSALQDSVEEFRESLERDILCTAPKIAATCQQQLNALRCEFDSNKPLLEKWLTADQLQKYGEGLDRLAKFSSLNQFNQFQSQVKPAEAAVEGILATTRNQEQAHERRIYLVSSLMQVCDDMGFRVKEKPQFTDTEDRGSQIRVVFDTGNRGDVVFLLSLDTIEVDSCISGSHCFEEFQQLSEQLKAGFGVETHFRGEAFTQPRKRQKGELDEPTGGQQSAGT